MPLLLYFGLEIIFRFALSIRGARPATGGLLSQSERNDVIGRARDELFSHIHRCGVLKALPEHQVEWMNETVEYVSERYPELTRDQLGELRTMGLRFCSPVIDHSQVSDAETEDGGEAAASEAAAA